MTPPLRDDASAAGDWRPLVPFVAAEARLAAAATRRPVLAALYEFGRFGVKQAWASLFGAAMLALLIVTHFFYPQGAPLARYDFLVLAALAIQAAMLATRLETLEEAKLIFVFHVVGTVMEIFKTAGGSWVYPEPSLLRIGGVPLFTGFMYASVGSFIARDWRLFHFRFERHPPLTWVYGLAAAIYANFFLDHWGYDLRWYLIAAAFLMFRGTTIRYRVWRVDRGMPLLLANVLTAGFLWAAENIGTFTHAWIYPAQAGGWHLLGLAKFSSWFLLLIVSYALIATLNRPQPP